MGGDVPVIYEAIRYTPAGLSSEGSSGGGLVIKVGGSILDSPASYIDVARRAKKLLTRSGGGVVVVSAMKGVTDLLLKVAEGSHEKLSEVAKLYGEAAYEVGGEALRTYVLNHLGRVKEVLRSSVLSDPSIKDFILSLGEILSKEILLQALRSEGIDAEGISSLDVIRTDGKFGNASIMLGETKRLLNSRVKPLISSGVAVVMEGFIGKSMEGYVTTLGRGGSDYTAVTVATLLKVPEVRIVTNVPGIMSADPSIVPEAKRVDELTLREVAEASVYGAKRLHPRTFSPISIHPHVSVFVGEWEEGTRIDAKVKPSGRPKLVTYRKFGEYFYIAVVGEGMRKEEIIGSVLEVSRSKDFRVEGLYTSPHRPSVVFSVKPHDLREAVKLMHSRVIEGVLHED